MRVKPELVSTIIPTYNRAVECKRAVESVLSQTHENVEVIVVDDGSEDNTREIVCYLDARVKYVWQPNAGVSAARNTGLKEAKGDYVAFLDSDDIWLPWKLEAQLSVLRRFPDSGMVWTDMKAVDENGTHLHDSYIKIMYGGYSHFDREKHFRKYLNLSEVWVKCPHEYDKKKCYTGNIFSWMFMGNLVHTSTVLLRRDRQEKVGFFDVGLLKSGEDYDFHFRTCRVGEVSYIDIPTILYRVGAADQLTNEGQTVWIARNNLITLKKMLSLARNEIRLPKKLIRNQLAWSYAWVGKREFKENRMSVARLYLINSLRFFPLQAKVVAYLFLSFLPPGTIDKFRPVIHLARRFKKNYLDKGAK
jgi:glycosyltransferase involved in cell wall biosynthesis